MLDSAAMKRIAMIAALTGLCACAGVPKEGRIGVLVMAHGGEPEWNQLAEESLEPLRAAFPTELALGMARADTLQKAVSLLERRGVRRIAVVRLFLSGDSFLIRTEKILGTAPGAGPRPAHWDMSGHDMSRMMERGPDAMPLWRVESRSRFVLTREGLLDGPIGGRILVKRARELSADPSVESVLLLGHGVGDDAADAAWRESMMPAVEALRRALPFHTVQAATMRDDWPEKRALARREIRLFVNRERDAGRKVLAIPYRLSGFGPQADMLKDLELVMDGRGLLPDPAVGEWMLEQARAAMDSAGWRP